jgi:hypothetical protein
VQNGGSGSLAEPASATAGNEAYLPVELRWGNTEAGCLCWGMQAPVPGSDDKFRVADG